MRNKPRIRFKGFTEDWEQRKLGEIADITKLAGFEFTKYIVYSDKGNIIALRGLNIKDGDLNLEDVKYIDSSDFTKLKRSKLFRNDILFTYVGTIGEVARIQEDDKYYLAPNVSRIRIKNRLLSEFLMYYMDRDLFYQKIICPLIATSSQPALSMANIREFNITYPSDINEQQKIALVFNRISHLITLHQRKLEKLKLAKKALLQKLFPKNGSKFPELRFKGFADAWEQRELSSLTEYIGTGKSRFVIKEFGEYAILGSTNVIGYDDAYDYDGNFILTARVGANAGQLYQYSGKVKITDNTVFLMSDHSQFIYYALTHFDLRRLSFGTGQPLVKSSELQKLKLCVPVSKSEQEKIGEIFNNIDNIITLHQRKLDKLQEVKKGLLQKMFV